MGELLTFPTATATATCQPWCWLHHDDAGTPVCIGETTVLDFPDATVFQAQQASVGLDYDDVDGVTVSVDVGHPDFPLSLDAAEAVADLIKAKVETARRAGAR